MAAAMATKGAGSSRPTMGSLGKSQATARDTRAVRNMPCISSSSRKALPGPAVRNWSTCSRAMQTDRPLTKPSSTVCGTSDTKRESRSAANAPCRPPHISTTKAMPPRPRRGSCVTSTKMTAVEAEEQEMRPGRPPTSALLRLMNMPAQTPLSGETPAIRAKDTACGRQLTAEAAPERRLPSVVPSGGSSAEREPKNLWRLSPASSPSCWA
mmetsp:Transcript_45778/g.146152  ORF Transcript_45778/g.146152 Transcript_45778/m.146152 type:complete len:211 (+) Transcript_45778:1032-1664(+)